jgi:hypothetical protein
MKKPLRISLTSKVVVYPGVGGWRFLGLPAKQAKEIKEQCGARARAWGSLPVVVTVGKTTWETSLFPDTKSGTYLLPLKAQVRKREGIADTATVRVTLAIR